MALSKYTMFFQVATGNVAENPQAIRLGGWTESVYDDNLTSANTATFPKLMARRAALLPDTGLIVAQRWQNLDPVGPATITLQRYPGSSGPCDYPSLSLLCRFVGEGVRNSRPYYLRAVPDAMITRGEYTPDANFRRRVNVWISEMGGWNFKAQDLGNQVLDIIGIEADGTFTLAGDLVGLAANSRVKVFRTTVLLTERQVGGYFWVTQPTPTSYKLVNWPHGESAGGTMRLANYIYPNIPNADGGTTGRIVTKKVGRPFEQFRGRQSNRR